jgi:ribosome biogenesis protein MAK21
MNLLERQNTPPKPEFAAHTLMHFLDKFVYRSPKSTESSHGSSIMQPVLASGKAVQVVIPGKASQHTEVNSAAFWNLERGKVAAEDVFFHEYYTKIDKPGQVARAERMAKKKENKIKKGDEDGMLDDDDEDAEDEIWEALVNSKPEIEGGLDEDSDEVDMEGYDDDSDDDGELPGASQDLDERSDGSGGFEGIFDDSEADSLGNEPGAVDEGQAAEGNAKGRRQSITWQQEQKRRKKELKALPTFASAEDYEAMVAEDSDGFDG